MSFDENWSVGGEVKKGREEGLREYEKAHGFSGLDEWHPPREERDMGEKMAVTAAGLLDFYEDGAVLMVSGDWSGEYGAPHVWKKESGKIVRYKAQYVRA